MELREDLKLYAKLAQRGVGYVAGQLELTSGCFQKCIACDSWRSDIQGTIRDAFTYEQAVALLEELDQMQFFEHLSFTGGDPQYWLHGKAFDRLLYTQREYWRFSTQANTALASDSDWDLWRKMLDRVRVSLDGVTPLTYRRMRGVPTDPEEILARMEALAHPMLATNTCVTDKNIEEVPQIIERLNAMKNPPRKAMFLAVLDFEVGPDFWRRYGELKSIPSPRVPTSFAEDVAGVREFVRSEEASEIPCYAGAITFHIKCNGDVYPCCLVGGEAIKTRPEMAIGNVKRESLTAIHSRYRPGKHYADKAGPCVAVCQWKQLQINRLGHQASKTTLAMP